MRNVLITGVNSYVGNNFYNWLLQNYSEEYKVDRISLRGQLWRETDFSKYDSVLHVAGLAHVTNDRKMEEQYYKINRDLTIEVAKKSKKEKVKQFIFMSSIIVYGDSKTERFVINKNTKPNPSNIYGRSKLEAEEKLLLLEDDNFKVAIIRSPMIYGKSSKGNYAKLSKAARKLPFFPNIDNERSMIYIDNLSEFLRLIINNNDSGIFFPQNKDYVKTSEMVKIIAQVNNKKIYLTKFFNPIIGLMIGKVNVLNKLFGNLVYEKELSVYKVPYQRKDFYESIKATEIGE